MQAALAFSGDGKLIAHADQGGVRLLNAATGKELRRLEPVEGFVHCLAGSPDSRTFAAACLQPETGTTHVSQWELASGQVRRRLEGHKAQITCLAYSPDGGSLGSGSADTTVLLWDLRGRSRIQGAAKSPSLDELWSELAAPRAERAYQAILELAAAPREAVALLKARLFAGRSQRASLQDIDKLVADLGSAQFASRDRATRLLEQLGERAEPALQTALKRGPSLELRRRIEDLLSRIEKGTASPEELRGLRTVEVLEMIGSEEARQLLAKVARGAPETRIADQARAASARLAQRGPP